MAYARQHGFAIELGSDYSVTLAKIVSLKSSSNCTSRAWARIYAIAEGLGGRNTRDFSHIRRSHRRLHCLVVMLCLNHGLNRPQ